MTEVTLEARRAMGTEVYRGCSVFFVGLSTFEIYSWTSQLSRGKRGYGIPTRSVMRIRGVIRGYLRRGSS